ncbi:MAG: hypothetical protein ACK5NN_01675 [Sphingomonadaceae bacterium]
MRIDIATSAFTGKRTRRRPVDPLLKAVLALAGGYAECSYHRHKPWASITFSGGRHHIGLAFSGADAVHMAEHFIAELPDHEFSIAGKLVAEARIVDVDHRLLPDERLNLALEILLLDEC